MSTGQIVPIAPLASENSSYTLTFEGPRVVCRNLTMTNITIPSLPHGISVNAFNATPPEYTLPGENMDFMYFTQTKTMGYYPAKRVEDIDLFSNETFTMVFERQTTQCESFTTMYQVNISYVRGIQQTTYSTGMDKRLIYLALDTFRWNKTEHYEVPKETQGYKDWAAEIPEWVYKTNSRAILESVSSAIAYQWVLSVGRSGSEPILGTYRLPNGSAIELASLSDINSRPESTNSKFRIVFTDTLLTLWLPRLYATRRQRAEHSAFWSERNVRIRPTHVARHLRGIYQCFHCQRHHFCTIIEHLVWQH
jgi:hypothetical protein